MNKRNTLIPAIYIIMFSLLLSGCFGHAVFDNENIRKIVKKDANSVDVPNYFPDRDVRNYLHEEFIDFYKERDYKLAWLSFDEPTPQADALLEAIDASHEEGLSPEHYNMSNIEFLLAELYEIESRKERRKVWRRKLIKSKNFKARFDQNDLVLFDKIVRLDFLMTANYLTYASRLLSGTIKPDETADWYSKPREKDLSKHLTEALEKDEIKESLMELNPPHPQYNMLKEKLAYFTSIKKDGGWEQFSISKTLKPGDNEDEVQRLRKRLQLVNYLYEAEKLPKTLLQVFEYLDQSEGISMPYGTELEKAVKLYQMHHGLKMTGTVNEKTRIKLNEPVEEVIQNISFNMERMRWIHGSFGDHYILVNIAAFQMTAIKDNQVELKMKAIVGKSVNKTPVFNDSIEYIVFSPEWNVPRSIAVNEMLPRIKKDHTYLEKRNLSLYSGWDKNADLLSQHSVNWNDVTSSNFNFRIVESSGPSNALGLVKFIFPNSKSVYLHDTPAHHLFSQNKRDFSHGCVRLEKPGQFAKYLLQDKGLDEKVINSYMGKSEPTTISLTKKIPIYIVYWTAWVDEGNNFLNIREDVYSYDQVQMEMIDQKRSRREKKI